jgi:hypothetical protein
VDYRVIDGEHIELDSDSVDGVLCQSGYGSLSYDITQGTSSRRPSSPAGQTPAGGAAQAGYDLATGLGSLMAAALAEAVASLPDRPEP